MAGKYAVETVFSAVDAMTAPLRKMTKSVSNFGGVSGLVHSKINSDISKANEKLDSFGESMKGIAFQAVVAGVAAVSAGIVAATKQFVEFDETLRKAGAAFKDFSDLSASDTEKALKDLGAEARKVAAATEFDANQTAQALETMAKAGLSSGQAVTALSGIADVASAAGVSLNDASSMIINGVNSLNMASDDPLKMAENMTHLADVMAYTADSANMSMTDFGEFVKVAGGYFQDINNNGANNINTLSAMATSLANFGFSGSEAGKAISTIMSRLNKLPTAGKAAMDALGVDTVDATTGALKDMSVIVDEMNAAFDRLGYTEAERAGALKDIFGQNFLSQGMALLTTGGDAIRKYEQAALDSAGSAAVKAEKIRKSMKNQIAVMFSGLTEMGFQFVEGFQNPFVDAVSGINDTLSKMNTEVGADGLTQMQRIGQSFEPVIKALQGALEALLRELPNIAKWVGNIIVLLVNAISVVWNLRGVIVPLLAAIMAYKGVIMAAAIGIKIWNAAMVIGAIVSGTMTAAKTAETAATVAQAGATATATGAQWGFNAAMAANPIGIVILAIVALVAILAVAYNKCDEFRNTVNEFWASIEGLVGTLLQSLMPVVTLVGNVLQGVVLPILKVAMTILGGILGFIFKIIGAMAKVAEVIIKTVLTPVQMLIDLLSKIPLIGGAFKNIKLPTLLGTGTEAIAQNSAADAIASQGVFSGGEGGEDAAAQVAPMSSAEKTSYLKSENFTENRLNIGIDKGLTGKWVGSPAPNVSFRRATSAAF